MADFLTKALPEAIVNTVAFVAAAVSFAAATGAGGAIFCQYVPDLSAGSEGLRLTGHPAETLRFPFCSLAWNTTRAWVDGYASESGVYI